MNLKSIFSHLLVIFSKYGTHSMTSVANFQFSVYDIRIYIYHYVIIFFPVFVGDCLIGIRFSLLLTL